jgi:hypothetical protein
MKIVTGRWNPDFVKLVSAQYLLPGAVPRDLEGIAFGAVADNDGLSIWRGARRPTKVAVVGWSDIAKVRAGSKLLSGVRQVSTVDIEFLDGSGIGQFAVAGERWIGAFPQGSTAVQMLTQRLDEMRAHSARSQRSA